MILSKLYSFKTANVICDVVCDDFSIVSIKKKSLVFIVVEMQNCSSFAPCLFTTPLHSVLSQAFLAYTTDCMFLRDW